MNKVTCSITMSLDAFVAGPNQSFEKPFGDIPENLLHHWMFDEPEKHQAELDAFQDAGAFIMGSNMFGPKEKRGSTDWKGWWGGTGGLLRGTRHLRPGDSFFQSRADDEKTFEGLRSLRLSKRHEREKRFCHDASLLVPREPTTPSSSSISDQQHNCQEINSLISKFTIIIFKQ
jgi:hypothetical protein